MKKTRFFSLLSGTLLFAGAIMTNSLHADCINSCGSINDGKCSSEVTCERDTETNCNRYDSAHQCLAGV